jgi:DNA-directed RNA polymerase subunit RPC12/RpoP
VTVYRCARCGRKLKPDRYIYSRFTGNRYCFIGHCRKRIPKAERLPQEGAARGTT